jgi:hypothetical protein
MQIYSNIIRIFGFEAKFMQIDVYMWKIIDTTWIILVWTIQILSFKFFLCKIYL